MPATAEKTVRDLALENPAATRIFERLRIDYCCGGGRTLTEACRAAAMPVEAVLAALDAAAAAQPAPARDWQTAPLADLVGHIQNTHHVYTREVLARVPALLETVCATHGPAHPELLRIRDTWDGLSAELSTHMMKEEMVLFPYIVRMEEAVLAGEPVLPPPFGTVRNPVAMMMREHDGAGDALREIRAASNNFTVPEEACLTFRSLYTALAEFEADLHQHIHLENNILFPRALELER